jgi:hypothetical protein
MSKSPPENEKPGITARALNGSEINSNYNRRIAKKRPQHKRLLEEHLTVDQTRKTEDALGKLLLPFLMVNTRGFRVPSFLLLRDIELEREKDGRVRVCLCDICDALWNALEEQDETAKAASVSASPVVRVEWDKKEGQ